MTEPTLREQYGQALRRWGLLDEVNDPAATEEFAVTDLLSVRDEEMERMKHLVAASSEDGHTVRRVAALEAEVARLTQAVTDADQDAAEAREHTEQTCEAVTERDQLRTRVEELEAKAAHLTAGQCTHTRAMCQEHHTVAVNGCPYPRCVTARKQEGRPEHLAKGTNAEDCPACKGTNPDYPFLCPGPTAPGARP